MPFRVREILLVSSSYDAFVLEEDGSLSDRLFYEYSELSLSWAPRITHARSSEHALRLLSERRFDLVITVAKIGESDAGELSSSIKERDPAIPIVLLIFDEAELQQFPEGLPPPSVDRVFQWTGNAGLLIAVIKSTEDKKNVEHDTRTAGVQVILVVEDRVRAYSSFLALLYPELLTQAGSLIAEGLNDFHRLMRMRARPKIVLANNFDDALGLYQRHKESLCALMTDVRIPRGGREQQDAGLELARLVREGNSDLPILIQTAERDVDPKKMRAWLVDKNAPNFKARVRGFLQEALGFGDFVFRLPGRAEVARARDTYEMEQALLHVPAESIAFHASANHFSVWLRARSMFELARKIQPQRLDDFDDPEQLRNHLVGVLQQARWHEQEGVITDLGGKQAGPQNRFVRACRGSMGGKGRGVAFVNTQIVRHGLLERFDKLQIRIPKTVVLGTDAFDAFMGDLDIEEILKLDDATIRRRFVERPLPDWLVSNLRSAYEQLKGPLAVRSSSLLEDSRFQPFAGVYATYMLPNNHPDAERRFADVLDAIRSVYASSFWREAQQYLAGTPHEADEQKMAIVIQQVIGHQYGTRYYPHMSGVAQSYNYYPIGAQEASDGVASVALGMGQTVVGGGVTLRFSPGAPTVLPQFPSAEAFLNGSQTTFLALDLSPRDVDLEAGPAACLVRADLSDAEADGTLAVAGSVFCAGDDVIRENMALNGPRVVTFNNVLKWNSVPLAEALTQLLALLRKGIGEEVEIEFALDMAPWLREPDNASMYPNATSERRAARLYVLQVRPMTSPRDVDQVVDLDQLDDDQLLCRTNRALGHGVIEGIHDIIYVTAEQLDSSRSRSIAAEVGRFNEHLMREKRPYLLIGPGRWGSSDPTLGISVGWRDIAAARVIVETPIGTRQVEPSQGTHFFRNITARRVGYLTLGPRDLFDRQWLAARATADGPAVKHIRLEHALSVHLDGRKGHAVILKRGPS